jgi:hypothetical protein
MPTTNSRLLHIDAWVGLTRFLMGTQPGERTTPEENISGQTCQHPSYSRMAAVPFKSPGPEVCNNIRQRLNIAEEVRLWKWSRSS